MSSVIESIAMESSISGQSSTNLHALLAEADLGLYNGDDIRKLTEEKFFWLLDHSLTLTRRVSRNRDTRDPYP